MTFVVPNTFLSQARRLIAMWRSEKAQEAMAEEMIRALRRLKLSSDIVSLIDPTL
jgi:hypothetical protein